MIRPATTIALFLSAGAGFAETPIRIQSGEHESFTRLVLSVDPARDWTVTNSDGRSEFSLQGQEVTFDTSNLFARIPRTRLAEVSQHQAADHGNLILSLNCACSVTAFAYQGAYVVLDIAQRADHTPAETATAPGAQPARQSPALFAQAYSEDAPQIADIGIETFGAPITIPAAPRPNHHPDLAVAASPDSETSARIAEAQAALLTQLTRAAEQGLIEFSAPIAVAYATKSRKKPVPDHPDPAPSPGLARQITATTAYDRDGSAALAEIVNSFARTHCLDDAAFDFAQWGGDADFNSALGQLHSAMVEERDRPLPQAATELVRFYLRYGLGREARSLLASYALEAENPLLVELALLADDAAVPAGGVLDLGRGCGGAHELWRLIALPDAVDTLPVDMDSIFEAFAALPLDLRTAHIGSLVATLAGLDAPELAQHALDMVARAGQAQTPGLRLIRAEMMLRAFPLEAEALLADLVEENAENAPEAMLLWAQSLLLREGLVPEALVQSLAAAAFELRSTAQGRALRLAEIRLRAGVDGFDAALALITADLGRDALADAGLRSAAQDIFANATPDMAKPSAYIETVMRYRGLLDAGRLGDTARREIAQHFVALALPAAALDLLQDTPDFDDKAQLLAAQADLALFNPQAALARLDGRRDLPALSAMASAYAQLGQHDAALEMLIAADAGAAPRADAAFLAGAWGFVDTAAPESSAMLAAYMQQREAPDSEVAQMGAPLSPIPASIPNTLEAARATLDANRESRAYLQGLLAPTPPE